MTVSIEHFFCKSATAASAKIPTTAFLPAWAPTAHQYAAEPTVPERFADKHENARYSGVFFIWGHAFEFHDKTDWASLERISKPLSGKPDVWHCTNIEPPMSTLCVNLGKN